MRRLIFLISVLAFCSCEKRPVSSRSQTPSIINTAGGQEMVLLPAGEFMMGSTRGETDEAPPHKVRVNSILMDRTEVTQEMYEKLQLVNPSKVKGPKLPVHMMSWVLAARYCNERSQREGLDPCYNEENATCDFTRNGYRLPTEAEWEYACRAGADSEAPNESNLANLRKHIWFADNSGGKPHPVAEKPPNPWGLYDMLGNIAEWCNDIYDKQYYRNSPADNPRGPQDGDKYVVRGGSYISPSRALRPSARAEDNPGFSDACLAPETLGFRCVRKPPPNTSEPPNR